MHDLKPGHVFQVGTICIRSSVVEQFRYNEVHLFEGYIILEYLFTFTEAEDQADIDQAIKLLLEKYLVSKNDVSKRDYIRLM